MGTFDRLMTLHSEVIFRYVHVPVDVYKCVPFLYYMNPVGFI